MTRWESPGGEAYAARFDALERDGVDVHGEAGLVERLCRKGSRVLDAGCGTGRVAIRLAERGFVVSGIDVDADMLATARRRAPQITWAEQSLTEPIDGEYDVVVAAGNVVPLVDDPGRAVRAMAGCLAPHGLLVTGFGLAPSHLPLDHARVDLASYDAWCTEAGLTAEERWSTWDRQPYDGGPYAVTVSRKR